MEAMGPFVVSKVELAGQITVIHTFSSLRERTFMIFSSSAS